MCKFSILSSIFLLFISDLSSIGLSNWVKKVLDVNVSYSMLKVLSMNFWVFSVIPCSILFPCGSIRVSEFSPSIFLVLMIWCPSFVVIFTLQFLFVSQFTTASAGRSLYGSFPNRHQIMESGMVLFPAPLLFFLSFSLLFISPRIRIGPSPSRFISVS